ncbi:MAG TPA: DMT family transporter [Spirochaetia bacterium]|nr:DMT family transporter [Spirochaetia bacterium]
MEHHKDFYRGVVMMLVSNVFFSAMALFARAGALVGEGISALSQTQYRFAIGMGFIVILAMTGRIKLRFRNYKGLLLRGFVGGISVLLLYLPIQFIGLAKTSVIYYTYPVFASLFGAIFFKNRPTLGVWLSIILAVAGMVVINWEGFADPSTLNAGIILAVAGSISAGLAVVMIKKLTETESNFSIYLAQCLVGFWLFLIPSAAVPLPPSWMTPVILLGVGVFALAGQLSMNWSYKRVDVNTGSLFGTIVPVFNIIGGVLIFREELTLLEIIGTVITLSACVMLVVIRSRSRAMARQG